MKKLLYKKGILLKVTSWENDRDHYNTKEVYVDSVEEGKALKHMLINLFKSRGQGLGNKTSSKDVDELIRNYYDASEYFQKEMDLGEFTAFVKDNHGEYLGYSEFYYYRVCESCELYEIKEDVFVEEIKIE